MSATKDNLIDQMNNMKEKTCVEFLLGVKHKAKEIKDTGYICTNYFNGKDGLGTCNTSCQYWNDDNECVCAKGSKNWDGIKITPLCNK